jgi:hypothetical protein
MSHFTEIQTQIKDIEALRLACQELGLDLLQNAEVRGYYEICMKGPGRVTFVTVCQDKARKVVVDSRS